MKKPVPSLSVKQSDISVILKAIDYLACYLQDDALLSARYLDLGARIASGPCPLSKGEADNICHALDFFIQALQAAFSNPLLAPSALPGSPSDLRSAESARSALLPYLPDHRPVHFDF